MQPGQRNDICAALPRLDALPARPGQVVADRGFSTRGLRAALDAQGIEACIPPRRTERAWPWDRALYKARDRVERPWARLKEARAVAARYDRSAKAFTATLLLAGCLDWIR